MGRSLRFLFKKHDRILTIVDDPPKEIQLANEEIVRDDMPL